jgi:superfamily II DNA or RNA helicase
MMLRPRQKLFVERSLAALDTHNNTLGVAPTGCHAAGTAILMFDGSIRAVETIAVGDLLMGPGGTPRRVMELHRGRDQMVEIRPLKGDPFTVNLGHILTLVRTNEGKLDELRDRDGELVDISVADWLAASHDFRHLHKLLRMPVDFPGRPSRRMKKNVLRCGFTVHPVGEGEYFGFTVDGDHRYLMGDFTVTHNSGKTVMLSAVTGAFLTAPDARACVLAHRDELTEQNRAKFSRVNPGISTSVVDASVKSWDAQATFAMVPTLSRKANLDDMPDLDLLVIDEAHHAVADSYRRIIERARTRNPALKIFGVTATPSRGDGQGLREIFDNVADQIRMAEQVLGGHLVKPRTFVINVGVQEALKKVRRVASDFDMNAVAEIMDKSPVTDAVIAHWKEKAGSRQTVVFCSTVEHAQNVAAAFRAHGIAATTVHGEMSDAERKATLGAYAKGRIQVITNVAVLTEGWDHPPTSCVVLLRPSSYKSTMIQMVGRGLRTVNPEEYPGVVKTDCIILDFGTSSLIHGSLEQDVNLKGYDSTEDSTQSCHNCSAVIPLSCTECPICGEMLLADVRNEEGDGPEQQRALLSGFDMTEIDLLARSSFEWVDLFGDGASLVANGFNAWAGIFAHNGRWYGVGGAQHKRSRLLAMGEELVCLAAADDWLNTNETNESAHKTRGWLNQPPTEKQLAWLPEKFRLDYGLTRYRASALLTFKFNKTRIQELIMDAAEAAVAEAA